MTNAEICLSQNDDAALAAMYDRRQARIVGAFKAVEKAARYLVKALRNFSFKTQEDVPFPVSYDTQATLKVLLEMEAEQHRKNMDLWRLQGEPGRSEPVRFKRIVWGTGRAQEMAMRSRLEVVIFKPLDDDEMEDVVNIAALVDRLRVELKDVVVKRPDWKTIR